MSTKFTAQAFTTPRSNEYPPLLLLSSCHYSISCPQLHRADFDNAVCAWLSLGDIRLMGILPSCFMWDTLPSELRLRFWSFLAIVPCIRFNHTSLDSAFRYPRPKVMTSFCLLPVDFWLSLASTMLQRSLEGLPILNQSTWIAHF